MKRHRVILGDLKLDRAWWAHTKLAILYGTIAVVILAIYAFVL